MKLYAPKYYREFACIADRCRHSCCIGWEIDVDGATLEKYNRLNGGYGERIKNSICMEETPHFSLGEGDRCPHLNEHGLCSVILHYGEGYLCDICREHPRFYHKTKNGLEVGLGMSCEEAARIILTDPWDGEMIEIDRVEDEEPSALDTVAFRDGIYRILFDRSLPYAERLARIYGRYGVSPSQSTDAQWRDRLAALEYLDKTHRALFACYTSSLSGNEEHAVLLERALAYFIFRHCAEVFGEEELFAALGFCLFCERLLASILRTNRVRSLKDAVEYARILSEEIEYSEENTEDLTECFL